MRVCAHCYRTLGDAERACSRDGTGPIELPAFPLPADLQGRFQGLEPFAQSPHSASYLATQPGTGFRGLLKVIPLHDLDASERGRLKRELRKQVKLSHPNLPRIVDGGELASDLWLLRDHVDGESLAQRLKRQGPLELQDALAVLAQVASALDELHRAGILHRDVRPSRIVLSPREAVPMVKLLDAGIAARQRTGSVFDRLGTPAYMSPEQIAGKLVSFRSDLYALGCVFYEMLAGQPPFGLGESPDALRALLDAHQKVAPPAPPIELPPAVASLLASLLDKEPRKRPFSAQQVRRTLEPHLPPGMPVVTPGRSSVAGAAAPAAGRRSGSGPVRPSAPAQAVLPARPSSSKVNAPVKEEITVTEDLELVEAPPSLAPGGFREGHTVDIPTEELSALRIEPSLAPPPAEPVSVPVPADIEEEAATTHFDAAKAKGLLAAELGERSERATGAPDTLADPMDGEPSTASMPAPPPAEPPEAPMPRRPSVAFDVESLFNDPQEEPPPVVTAPQPSPSAAPPRAGRTAIDEAAPTQVYQKADDAAREAFIKAREQAEQNANQDRTVVTRMPQAPGLGRNKVIAGASALAAVILLFAMCRGGDEATPAAEANTQQDDAQATEHVVKPAGTVGSAPEAPSKSGDDKPASGVTAATPTTTGTEPAAAAAEPAQGDKAADPAAEEQQAAVPEQPAAATAPETTTTNTATAPSKPTATAPSKPQDTGAAPPARRNAPDAVVGQRASRAERVARAEKHKLEARAHYQAGRFKEAARSYELATRETPSDGGAFAGLGASLLASNQPDPAIKAYQRAVQIDGKSSGFHAALGRAYAMKGDRARAKTAYQRALALNPKNTAAQQGLDKLK